jgi:hypothetical protein
MAGTGGDSPIRGIVLRRFGSALQDIAIQQWQEVPPPSRDPTLAMTADKMVSRRLVAPFGAPGHY